MRKLRKKTLLCLMVLLVMMVFEMDLSASSKITSVEIYNFTQPTYGEKPKYNIELPRDADYHLATSNELSQNHGYHNGMCWIRKKSETYMLNHDLFAHTKDDYQANIIVIANQGYSFDDEVFVTINGEEMLIEDQENSSSELDIRTIGFRVEDEAYVEKPKKKRITRGLGTSLVAVSLIIVTGVVLHKKKELSE